MYKTNYCLFQQLCFSNKISLSPNGFETSVLVLRVHFLFSAVLCYLEVQLYVAPGCFPLKNYLSFPLVLPLTVLSASQEII